MRIAKKITYLIMAFVLVLIIFRLISLRQASNESDQDANSSPLKVVAQVIKTADLAVTIPVTGSFEPLASVEVLPEISGQLKQLRLPDGTLLDVAVPVKAGDTIAIIEHAELDAAVSQAEAMLATAQANLQDSQVNLAHAQREKERIIALFEGGSATEQARDKAITAYERAKAAVAAAAANVKQAQAALTKIKTTLDKATIEAPITGIISKKYVDEGDMVGPTTPLVEIVQIKTLKVFGGVSERYLSKLIPGKTPVFIKTDAYPQDEFKGTVHKVGVTVDPVTRTATLEIRVPNPDMKLKPGMFARMTIVIGQKRNVVVVPESALIREYDNVYVFVVKDGKANMRKLELGLSQPTVRLVGQSTIPTHPAGGLADQDQYYEVLDGLSAGDIVITHGQRLLEDGQMVEVIQETPK